MNMEVVNEFLLSQEPGTLVAAGITGALLTMLGAVKLVRRLKGKKMATLGQKYVFADTITDALEDAVGSGKMSRQTANYWYRELGYRFNIRDLIPVNPHRWHETKSRLRREREVRKGMEAAGLIKAPRIPGPMPLQIVQTNVFDRPAPEFSLRKKKAA